MRVIIAYAPEPQAPRTPRHAAIAHEAAVRKAQLHTISRRSAESRARTNDSGTQGLLAAEVLMWPLADLDESGTEFAEDSSLEGGGFEPSVPPRMRRPSREAPRPTIVVLRNDLCLMTPSSLSVRHLLSATAERPFTKSGTNGSNPVPSSGESCEIGEAGIRQGLQR